EFTQMSEEDETRLPEFVGDVPNVTVQIGREARLPCVIRNLASYRAAWIRDEEKNILTLQRQMVTRDPRIMLQEESQMDIDDEQHDHNRVRYFVLIIRNVQVEDRGGYMCQINTVPMRSQIGFLRVVVPPDIIDEESSNDVMMVEGANVTLKCKAKGYPQPDIEWRREDGNRVPLGGSRRLMTNKTEGELLEIIRVTRVHSGAWLCIASNGVMPSVSRRILLNVQFSPQIWIPVEEIGTPLGSNITLDCHIEAYPLPLNYWTYGGQAESIYISGPKYEVSVKEKGYKRHLRLTIHRLEQSDIGLYRCHAQNALGRQEKQVRIYVSETHQQTHSKQSISSTMTTSDGTNKNRRKGRPKLRRKKMNQSEMVNNGSSNNNLLYSVMNTFRKSKSNSIVDQSSSSSDLANDGMEFEGEYDDNVDDYDHYEANNGAIGPSSLHQFYVISLALIAATTILIQY
ncbi:hypothetical protein BLOT_006300, partial [Blomia tropicalis]